MKKELKTIRLEEMIDRHIGKRGSLAREEHELRVNLGIFGSAIRQERNKRGLTQGQLSKLSSVSRIQISKIENDLIEARFETILKVFKALGAKVHFNIELQNHKAKVV